MTSTGTKPNWLNKLQNNQLGDKTMGERLGSQDSDSLKNDVQCRLNKGENAAEMYAQLRSLLGEDIKYIAQKGWQLHDAAITHENGTEEEKSPTILHFKRRRSSFKGRFSAQTSAMSRDSNRTDNSANSKRMRADTHSLDNIFEPKIPSIDMSIPELPSRADIDLSFV